MNQDEKFKILQKISEMILGELRPVQIGKLMIIIPPPPEKQSIIGDWGVDSADVILEIAESIEYILFAGIKPSKRGNKQTKGNKNLYKSADKRFSKPSRPI